MLVGVLNFLTGLIMALLVSASQVSAQEAAAQALNVQVRDVQVVTRVLPPMVIERDKARVVAVLWMYTGVVFVALYTAQLTATLTVQQIAGGASTARKIWPASASPLRREVLRPAPFGNCRRKPLRCARLARLMMRSEIAWWTQLCSTHRC